MDKKVGENMNNINKQYNTFLSDDGSYAVSIPKKNDDVIIYTGTETEVDKINQRIAMKETEILKSAIDNYDGNTKLYSVYPTDDSNADDLSLSDIEDLAVGLQSNLSNILKVNKWIRKYIIIDDIIGKTQEAIETNVNTNYKLSYNDFSTKKKIKQLNVAKEIIEKFNKQIRLKHLIKEVIPLVHAEGNYVACLRWDSKQEIYLVDHYPLGIAIVSDYTYGGKPIILIDMSELKSRLRKTYLKDKKNKALFVENEEKEIKENFPDEVYQAYKNNESYAKLNVKCAKIIRVNNLGRKYGVSPILRALKSALMLQTYENGDYINTKTKSKKIIFQKMRKETMGKDYQLLGIKSTIKAHSDLMAAWKNKTVVYTAIPQVEDLSYVEPSVEDTNADKINTYRSKIMTTLGIGFVDSNISNFSVANISLDQLMKTINSISEQLEECLEDWYEVLFENEGVDKEFIPEIQILDSEIMDMELRKELAKLLYTTFNGSAETSLGLLGINAVDEKAKRQSENEEGYDKVFTARQTAFTTSNNTFNNTDDTNGRPQSNADKNKQNYDNQRNNI